MSTLYPKEKYILHISNLIFYLDHGYTITKIHRGFSFIHENWIEHYITKLSKERKEAFSEFVKKLKKLFANAIFGKFMEDLRKHFSFHLNSVSPQGDRYTFG